MDNVKDQEAKRLMLQNLINEMNNMHDQRMGLKPMEHDESGQDHMDQPMPGDQITSGQNPDAGLQEDIMHPDQQPGDALNPQHPVMDGTEDPDVNQAPTSDLSEANMDDQKKKMSPVA
jgi:hypothetical protein